MLNQFYLPVSDFFSVVWQKTPQILFAVVVFMIFYLIARIISFAVKHNVKRFAKKRQGLAQLVSGTIFLAVVLLGLFVALNILDLIRAVNSLLAGVGIVGVALGFAF